MTLTTFLTAWLIAGFIGGLISIFTEWYHHSILESSTSYKMLESIVVMALAILLGPIGLVVIIYQKFIDTV
jgi:hypothetical protein